MSVPLADRMSEPHQNDRIISTPQRNRSACNAEISSVTVFSHLLIQVVDFHQNNAGGAYAPYRMAVWLPAGISAIVAGSLKCPEA
jgi:hypothetical protein